MKVRAVKTRKVVARSGSIYDLLNESLTELKEASVLSITSKVIAICEGRIVPITMIEKDELIKREADYFLPPSVSQFEYNFTIKRNTLISAAGIDESNGGGDYILWPSDPQKSANDIRSYLKKRFKLNQVGVLITDSSSFPLRYGTLVIPIGHSGFLAKNDYRGKPDLFGRPFKVSVSSIAGGLAAASGVVIGEGAEQTPAAIIEDVPFVSFQDRNPTKKELDAFYINHVSDDLFAPFLKNVKWQRGERKDQK